MATKTGGVIKLMGNKARKPVFNFLLMVFFILIAIPGYLYGKNLSGQDAYNLIMEQMEDGKYEQAIENSTTMINIVPESAVFYHLRAFAYFSLCKYDEAIRDFKKVLLLENRNKLRKEMAYIYLYSCNERIGQYDNAKEYLNKYLETEAALDIYSKEQATQSLALLSYYNRDYQKAFDICRANIDMISKMTSNNDQKKIAKQKNMLAASNLISAECSINMSNINDAKLSIENSIKIYSGFSDENFSESIEFLINYMETLLYSGNTDAFNDLMVKHNKLILDKSNTIELAKNYINMLLAVNLISNNKIEDANNLYIKIISSCPKGLKFSLNRDFTNIISNLSKIHVEKKDLFDKGMAIISKIH